VNGCKVGIEARLNPAGFVRAVTPQGPASQAKTVPHLGNGF
jgi:hypothetical protein